MANHKTGAQRYNDRKDKIFDEAKNLNAKYGNPDSLHSDNRSEAMKKSMAKKMYTKESWHKERSNDRKYDREHGYTKVKEKGYFDYSTRDRAKIRENFRPESNMNKWANSPGRKGKESAKTTFTSMKDYTSDPVKLPKTND